MNSKTVPIEVTSRKVRVSRDVVKSGVNLGVNENEMLSNPA